jgi:mono/diheme cytochrome c family protein
MNIRNSVLPGVVLAATLGAAFPAAGEPGRAPAAATPAAVAPHGLDATRVARGAGIYRANCAACHGDKAQGAPNWTKKGPDGKFPPPPLDAQGHAWHHPKSWLVAMVRDGTVKKGGGMPGWAGTLSDADIEAVLAWVQSLWPAELYQNWKAMDDKARAGAAHHHH